METIWLASEMAAFARVCELRSFTAAARSLGVPKVAVSRAVRSLERRLGSKLLNRTTRRVAPTSAGQVLEPYCARVLAEVDAVRSRYASTQATPLRVVTDAGYGRLLVAPLVPRFLESYGEVALQIGLLESLPASPNENWDLLVCHGAVDAPGLSYTALGQPEQILCATPAYLTRSGRPKAPADLESHTVLRALPSTTAGAAGPMPLKLRSDTAEVTVRLRPALQVSDPALIHSSTAAGLGIGLLPEFLCRQGLALGKLERVLSDWQPADRLDLRAVYPAASAGSPVIRLFLEFLLANMVPVLGGTSEALPARKRPEADDRR